MTLSCQVTCGKEKTHDNIVKIVKLQGNAPKKWGGGEYIPTDIGMAAAIPAIPLATPLQDCDVIWQYLWKVPTPPVDA